MKTCCFLHFPVCGSAELFRGGRYRCNSPLTRALPEGFSYVGFNAESLLLHSIDRLRQPRVEVPEVEFIHPEYVSPSIGMSSF